VLSACNNQSLGHVHQVRGILAQLGYEKLDDIIGKTEILKRRDVQLAKTKSLDLSFLMAVSFAP
jgi:glutamate synthase (ferredoxin)